MKEADWSDPSNPSFTGTSATTPKGILDAFTKYYSSLFADKNTDINGQAAQACLNTLSRPDPNGKVRRVLPPTAKLLDEPITAEEIVTYAAREKWS